MALFKVILLTVAATCVVNTLDIPEEWKAHAKILSDICKGETKVSDEHIQDADHGKFADDKELKCYMKCLFVKSGMMNEAGVFDAEAAIGLIPSSHKNALVATVNKCKSLVGADACDTAFLLHKCYYEYSPELYFLM